MSSTHACSRSFTSAAPGSVTAGIRWCTGITPMPDIDPGCRNLNEAVESHDRSGAEALRALKAYVIRWHHIESNEQE
ncbi:hypothetical protein D9M69_624080 [compost metagenome]